MASQDAVAFVAVELRARGEGWQMTPRHRQPRHALRDVCESALDNLVVLHLLVLLPELEVQHVHQIPDALRPKPSVAKPPGLRPSLQRHEALSQPEPGAHGSAFRPPLLVVAKVPPLGLVKLCLSCFWLSQIPNYQGKLCWISARSELSTKKLFCISREIRTMSKSYFAFHTRSEIGPESYFAFHARSEIGPKSYFAFHARSEICPKAILHFTRDPK